jgi:hypothetical protein
MKCNKCKSSNVQKFQVIHDQGTSNINIGSKTVGGGIGFGDGFRGGAGLASTGSKGTSQTLIANKTSPPDNSAYNRSSTILILFTSLAVILYFGLKNLDPSHYSVWVCVMIGVIIVAKYRSKDQVEYQRQYDEWLNKWYCNKCGNSFLVK